MCKLSERFVDTVGREVADTLTANERKKQETIYELIGTGKIFYRY